MSDPKKTNVPDVREGNAAAVVTAEVDDERKELADAVDVTGNTVAPGRGASAVVDTSMSVV
jgi:hypothetical protein